MPTKLVKLDPPPQYADGFTLDLYCDHDNDLHRWREFPHSMYGRTFADCAKQARDDGWVIHTSTRTATCPKCSGKKR